MKVVVTAKVAVAAAQAVAAVVAVRSVSAAHNWLPGKMAHQNFRFRF